MALCGNIVKAALSIHELLTDTDDHLAAQKKVLSKLLDTAKDTAFGKHYNFKKLLDSEPPEQAFAQAVP